MKLKLSFAIFWLAFGALAQAQTNESNFDESKVGTYTLPDPLVCADGTRVTSAKIWEKSAGQNWSKFLRSKFTDARRGGRVKCTSPSCR